MNTHDMQKTDFGQRFAIIVGSFLGSFSIHSVLCDQSAADTALSTLAEDGDHGAESIVVGWPSDLCASLDDSAHMTGTSYLVLVEAGVGNGMAFYGPFRDEKIVEELGTKHCPDGGKWKHLPDNAATSMYSIWPKRHGYA